jgi:hypothetical protein
MSFLIKTLCKSIGASVGSNSHFRNIKICRFSTGPVQKSKLEEFISKQVGVVEPRTIYMTKPGNFFPEKLNPELGQSQ